MQIKYRITLVYFIVVFVILLLFSIAIYIFSYQDRVSFFKERLYNKTTSTIELLTSKVSPDILKTINETSPSSLEKKSISIYDYKTGKEYFYEDDGAQRVVLNEQIINKVTTGKPYYYRVGNRDVVAKNFKDLEYDYIVIVAAYDIDRVKWLNKLQLILIICLFASLIIVFISGYIFSLSLVSAISEFTHKIKHISSEKFSLRLDTGKGKDELQKLAITINDLLDRLQASFNLQRRFIDNASHELSTPLASIASQMDVALLKERSSEDYKKAMLSINDDVRRLSLLVRSLLEIAKVSGSMGGTELTSVRVDELLMRLPSEMKKVSALYEVNVDFDEFPEDEKFLIIYGNEHLLYSAIKNIVHNACKFSEDNRADIKLSFPDNSIEIQIVDNGPGMDEYDLKNIFQPFYRSNRHESYISGAGLGLALAHRIIGLHRGHIRVDSALGEGTTFYINLPMEREQIEETEISKTIKQ